MKKKEGNTSQNTVVFSIEKITALCKCGNEAICSNRTIPNTSQILFGSTDVYEPLCRKCYIENNIF